MYMLSLECLDTCFYRCKMKANRAKTTGNRTVVQGQPEQPREKRSPTAVAATTGCNHSPWHQPRPDRGGVWPPRSRASRTRHFVPLFGPRTLPLLDHFGPLLQPSLIHMASRHLLITYV